MSFICKIKKTKLLFQALLDHANLSRQGNKRDLLQRCKSLITTNYTPQLANKIQQINNTRPHSSRSHHVSSTTSHNHPIVLPKTPPIEIIPPSNHIQFINLPFFEKMRTIECSNMPVDWHTFSPIKFLLNETDIDLIRKNSSKIFLRIAPTTLHERHNDVLPPYLFVQCNNQPVINNNISKQVGSQAHSISFPTDITDKLILRTNTSNSLSFLWLRSPTTMSFKNLPKSYTLSIQLVHCVSNETLFDLIVKRERYLNKTTNDNNNNDDSDIEIEDLGLMTTRHRVSLICPITQSLIGVPAKSSYCSHPTCFDLKAFLQMNERRLQWTCPICKKSAAFESLRIDERLQTVLLNVPPNCSTVEIDSTTDCQYILDSIKQEKLEITDPTHLHRNNEDESIHNSSTSKFSKIIIFSSYFFLFMSLESRHQSDESDCIVLSSGSESENEDNDIDPSSLPVTPEHHQENDNNSQSSHSSHSTPSPIISTVDDGDYWEDLAQITYDLSSDPSEKSSNRKRSNSSTSSVLSSTSSSSTRTRSNDDRHHHRKRNKRSSPIKSRSTDIEVITLTSSDSSDNNGQLS